VPLIASSHHEKLDGTGYPRGLKKEEIPLASRIMAVADMFDALTAKRDYPKYIENETVGYDPLPISMVLSIIRNGVGERFDEKVVEAFIECLPEIMDRFNGPQFLTKNDLELVEK
jgi:putative two-component system response regulator